LVLPDAGSDSIGELSNERYRQGLSSSRANFNCEEKALLVKSDQFERQWTTITQLGAVLPIVIAGITLRASEALIWNQRLTEAKLVFDSIDGGPVDKSNSTILKLNGHAYF
jgi:hypothetical protein